MAEPTPERPPFVPFVCGYEFFALFVGICTILLGRIVRAAHPNLAYPAVPHWRTAVTLLSYVLTVPSAIALWKLHRSAAVFLGGRFAISLSLFILNFVHKAPPLPPRAHPVIDPSVIHMTTQIISAFFLFVSAAFTWYAYRVTFHPSPIEPNRPSGPRPSWPAPPQTSF